MSSKSEKDRAKQIQDRCQAILMQMLKDEDNKYCVDCDAKGPRWASWNIGIFLCIRCAGIHRNLGVHISKVKSVTLDSWTPEQVVSLQQMGNSRARAVYEANLPDAFRRPQTDTSLEAFVRAKYEQKRYIAKEWVPPPLPKVNWEKEIDEEMEKQKRKKKSSNIGGLPAPLPNPESKSVKHDVIPHPLPKPKSVSPKLGGRNSSNNASSNSADLLGLNTACTPIAPKPETNTDLFNNMFDKVSEGSGQAVEHSSKVANTLEELKLEEDNFFKQTTTQVEQSKSKMTKDSILALYSQGPPISATPVSASQFGSQQPNLSYGVGHFAAPSMGSLNHGFAPNQSTGSPQQYNANYNRYVQQQQGGTGAAPFSNTQQSNNLDFSHQSSNLDFFNNQSSQQLNQQFGNLNLNQAQNTFNGVQSNLNSMWQ